ncbi:MAG: hypothetical protein WD598_08190 [Acidimicrobiia bacterium]
MPRGPEADATQLLVAVGRISLGGANLELRASLLAAAALGLPQRVGLYLLGRESASRALDHAREALEVADDCDGRAQALAWIARAGDAYRRRNELMHGVVGADSNGGLRRVRIRRSLTGPTYDEEAIELTAIVALGELLDAVAHDFDHEVTSALIRDLSYTRAALGHPDN